MTRAQYIKEFFNIYTLVSVLSTKNNCEVIKAKHKELGKYIVIRSYPVAIPVYEFLFTVKCKNLPIIYDVINLDDGQIVLEEYIDGMTVAEVLESGKYSYSGMCKVIKAVCDAIGVLHKESLVHRDIKPENVMITDDGGVVLIDFNTSRKLSSGKKDTTVMGTVGYASPEQLGISQSDARTDVYALGVMINVMLTGKHPSEELVKGKARRIVLKATRINPDERYQSAEILAKKL